MITLLPFVKVAVVELPVVGDTEAPDVVVLHVPVSPVNKVFPVNVIFPSHAKTPSGVVIAAD